MCIRDRYNHYKRIRAGVSGHTLAIAGAEGDEEAIEVAKSNILLVGPTGSGKTYLCLLYTSRCV